MFNKFGAFAFFLGIGKSFRDHKQLGLEVGADKFDKPPPPALNWLPGNQVAINLSSSLIPLLFLP